MGRAYPEFGTDRTSDGSHPVVKDSGRWMADFLAR